MGELVKILRDGRIAIFGTIADRSGNPIKGAIIILEGIKRVNRKRYRKVYGICKTDEEGNYVFFITDRSVNYKVNVFEDRYHNVDDVVRFIRG